MFSYIIREFWRPEIKINPHFYAYIMHKAYLYFNICLYNTSYFGKKLSRVIIFNPRVKETQMSKNARASRVQKEYYLNHELRAWRCNRKKIREARYKFRYMYFFSNRGNLALKLHQHMSLKGGRGSEPRLLNCGGGGGG